jgi:Rrf2 family protein
MLTRKTLYALKALSILAEDGDRGLVATGELAERGGIPRKFLETILRELQQHGILFSQRGPGGGYALRREPADIALATVVRALNGPLPAMPCVTQRASVGCAGCNNGHPCSLSKVMKELHDVTARVLETTTLLDLVRPGWQASERNAAAAYSI